MSKKLSRGIRRRGDSYLVDVTVGGVRRTATCATPDEAEAKRIELRQGLRAGGAVAAGVAWSLGEAWDRCHDACWSGIKSEHTVISMRPLVMGSLGEDTPITQITTDRLDKWVKELLASRNSNATINRKLSVVSKVLREATKRPDASGLLAAPHIPRRKEGQCRIRYLSLDEEQAVIGTLLQWGKADHADVVAMLLDTGMRCGELWHLTRFDMDFDARQIRVWENKADHPRSIPMTDRVYAILTDRAAERPFPFDNNWMHHAWDKLRSHLGYDDDKHYVPHMLRHTFASRLVQKGVPIQVVQALLGHKNITMTMRYAHLAPSNLSDAIAVLNRPHLRVVADVADVATVADD